MLNVSPVPVDQTTLSTASGPSQELGKEDFLTLLVAQLEAQDPLEPMESVEFTGQLAQFSSLEQLTNINTGIEDLQSSNTASTNASMINLIGKSINVPGDAIDFEPETTPTLSYSLEESAETATIEIYNSAGQLVRTLTEESPLAGTNQIVWDGKDNDLDDVPEGLYSFIVSAVDADGEDVEVETFSSGTVTDILFEDGETYALVNGSKVSASEITRISQ